MTLRRPLVLLSGATIVAVLATLALGVRSATAVIPPPELLCDPAVGCNGWHNNDVRVRWSYDLDLAAGATPGCLPITFRNEGVVTRRCAVTDNPDLPEEVWPSNTATVRI